MEDVEISRKFQMEDVEMGVEPKIWVFPPNHPILIGFSIHEIFTIHFGGKIPLFLVQHPNMLAALFTYHTCQSGSSLIPKA